MLTIRSVNISKEKGTVKTPYEFITLDASGVTEDAHAGPWHRQVSLLGEEAYQMMNLDLVEFPYGSFAENITTTGSPSQEIPDLKHCQPGDRFHSGDILLEVTQIGKKCHGPECAIFKKAGDCVMPREGIFARVLAGGTLKPGDRLHYERKEYRVSVITVSDRAYEGVYEDCSGPQLERLLQEFCKQNHWPVTVSRTLLPDDPDRLRLVLENVIQEGYDMIFTTGGTGIGPSDMTPYVVKPFFDKEIPGLMEYIRVTYGKENPNALLSAAVAGVAGKTLIFTLPGSVRAIKEYFTEIARSLKHMIYMQMGLDVH
ncbi:MAG: molybdenum cofactor synthesis protein [Bacteroidales bacterium]|nr:molybdenum cofactor synthesis protein [Bacteroidales bacterium]